MHNAVGERESLVTFARLESAIHRAATEEERAVAVANYICESLARDVAWGNGIGGFHVVACMFATERFAGAVGAKLAPMFKICPELREGFSARMGIALVQHIDRLVAQNQATMREGRLALVQPPMDVAILARASVSTAALKVGHS